MSKFEYDMPRHSLADLRSRISYKSAKKERELEAMWGNLSNVEASYTDAAASGRLSTFKSDQEDNNNPVPKEYMERLYKNKFRATSAEARVIYDEILMSPQGGLCPYCEERDVGEIDHYLPKSTFWRLAITPANLVPSCHECNFRKGSLSPSENKPGLIHPYYDDVAAFPWLEAFVKISVDPMVHFELTNTPELTNDLSERISKTWEIFGPEELYQIKAAQVLEEQRQGLFGLFKRHGGEEVRSFLNDTAYGEKKVWKKATYSALAASDEYCFDFFQKQLQTTR